jgi:hypothetical protein
MGVFGTVWWRRKIGFDPTRVLNGRKGEIERLQGLALYEVLPKGKSDGTHIEVGIAWAPDGRQILFECPVEDDRERRWTHRDQGDDLGDIFDRTESLPDIFELQPIDASAWRLPSVRYADGLGADIPGIGRVTANIAPIRRLTTAGSHASSMPESGWYAMAREGDEEFPKTPWWILLDDSGAPLHAFSSRKLNKI